MVGVEANRSGIGIERNGRSESGEDWDKIGVMGGESGGEVRIVQKRGSVVFEIG